MIRSHWIAFGAAWTAFWWLLVGAWAAAASPLGEFPGDLPPNALPVDVWEGQVLLAGPDGLRQMQRRSGSWHVGRTWTPGDELPEQFFGLARYLPDGSIAVASGPQVMRLTREGGEPRPWLSLPPHRHVHHLWVGLSGTLWIAYQPTPTVPEVLLQHWQIDGLSPTVRHEHRWSSAATVSDGCVDGTGGLWLATTGGLMQVSRGGQLTRQNGKPSHAVACSLEGVLDVPTGGELVELDRMAPGSHPRDHFPRLGQPIQVQRLSAEDGEEVLAAVLFSSGRLAWWRRDASGRLQEGGLLGPAQGLPKTVAKMLWDPSTERLLLGTRGQDVRSWSPFEMAGARR